MGLGILKGMGTIMVNIVYGVRLLDAMVCNTMWTYGFEEYFNQST